MYVYVSIILSQFRVAVIITEEERLYSAESKPIATLAYGGNLSSPD